MFERIARPFAGLSEWIARLANGIYRDPGPPGQAAPGPPERVLARPFAASAAHRRRRRRRDVATLLLVLGWFGVAGLEVAIGWALGLTCLAALGAIAAGLTDFKDTNEGDERNLAGASRPDQHRRHGRPRDRLLRPADRCRALTAIALVAGYLVLTVGAFIGGHLVFKYGVMVNYNAFARGKRAAEFTAVLPAAELPRGHADPGDAGGHGARPRAARRRRLRAEGHLLARRRPAVGRARSRATRSSVRWHASAFRLADGAVRHGPAASRQVSYAARINDGQVEVQGPRD